ncbi:MAG TPA: HAD-IC family P-type ATPase, partial [Jatrophihabitans sp.]|nr:HAD-IC family P-type ATPase [Jatrophihabitans sp.]
MKRFSSLRDSALFVCTGSLLVAGGALSILGRAGGATGLWYAATAVGVVYSAASIVTRAVRRQATVDVVALLALLGTVLVDEPFAGAVLALMLASGLLLEGRAQARARRELTLLVARAPRSARRYAGGAVEEVDVAEVAAGDRLLVGTGELAPVDGRLLGPAVLDESSLTGEARPVERSAGDTVRSGVVNAGGAFELRATAAAAESTYAGIVRLVQQAQSASSPYVRVADRIGLVFIPVTLLIAAMSWWLSGTLVRAVAVLVVATPCPLLLGVPIAVISGISRAARVGVVVKGGEALERLAAGRTLLLDKTGTLTAGRPELADLVAPGPIAADELLHLTASLDQGSAHPLASALVRAAGRRGVQKARPTA